MPSLLCVAYFQAAPRSLLHANHFFNNFYVYYPIATKLAGII